MDREFYKTYSLSLSEEKQIQFLCEVSVSEY